MSAKTRSIAIFSCAFTALLLAIHAPFFKLPFFWDELGQFVPAALDIYQLGAWIPKTTLPNVHPPGVMAYLALVWKIFGFSIAATRIAMLMVGAAGMVFSFLLAIRLSRKTAGAPAFAVVLFLLATPMFFTQSMMAQLDMPAMTFTALALLLFLEDQLIACAVVCTVLVLCKETAISTPFVFAVWLWFHDHKRRQTFYFLAPAIALGIWLIALHHGTGHWLGNEGFAQYNVAESLQLGHIFGTIERRLYFLVHSPTDCGSARSHCSWAPDSCVDRNGRWHSSSPARNSYWSASWAAHRSIATRCPHFRCSTPPSPPRGQPIRQAGDG